MPKTYYVYMMTNRSRTLYVGLTSWLEVRTRQHKNHTFEGFTSQYKCDRLVWFERHDDPNVAIAREKQIKRWSRVKEIALIVAVNPTWRDLSENWGHAAVVGQMHRSLDSGFPALTPRKHRVGAQARGPLPRSG
jgi:putative endonuclease